MKKILIIENSLYVTGGLNAILSSVDRLKSEYEFHFIIPEKSGIEEVIASKGYKVSRLPLLEISKSIKILWYLPRLFRNAKEVLKYMRVENIDLLHVNDIFNMLGCAVKRLEPSVKLVQHVRLLKTSYIARLYPYFARQVKKYADTIVCVSKAAMDDVGTTQKATVIYDIPKITNNCPPWNGLLKPEALKILYVGNYIRGKGQEHGLKAFIDLQKKYPDASIKFVGLASNQAAEEFKKELITMADEAGVISKVNFGDKIADIEKEMKDHDVVLNLSESESFSFVCLEAVLYGVPLVAANSGGPAEITDNGQMAMLVENKNVHGATLALEYIITHPDEIKEKAAKAKLWAEEKFNPEKSKMQLQKVYSSLS